MRKTQFRLLGTRLQPTLKNEVYRKNETIKELIDSAHGRLNGSIYAYSMILAFGKANSLVVYTC